MKAGACRTGYDVNDELGDGQIIPGLLLTQRLFAPNLTASLAVDGYIKEWSIAGRIIYWLGTPQEGYTASRVQEKQVRI